MGYAYLRGSRKIMEFEQIDEIRYKMEQFGTIGPNPDNKMWFLTTYEGRFTFGVLNNTKSKPEMAGVGPHIFMRGLNMNNKDCKLVKDIMSMVRTYVEDNCKPFTPR